MAQGFAWDPHTQTQKEPGRTSKPAQKSATIPGYVPKPKPPTPEELAQQTATQVQTQEQKFSQKPVQKFSPSVPVPKVTAPTISDKQMQTFLQAANTQGQYTPESMALLQAAAQGQGPSAAQNQLQAGIDAAVKAQLAAAGSRGFSAAAMRGAQAQGAEMQQAAANQAAALRAQEMQAAQQAFLQGALEQEQMARQAALQSGGLSLQAQTTGAELGLRAALANQQTAMGQNELGLQAQAMQQQGQLGYSQLLAELMRARLGAQFGSSDLSRQLNAAAFEGAANRRQALIGGLLGGAGTLGAAAIMSSDVRGKTNVKPNKQTEAFLSALTDNEYDYKDTSKPGTARGKQYGPMAQDLMKTKMGATAVLDTPDGLMVDPSRGFLLALSGLANINQRLSKLEGK